MIIDKLDKLAKHTYTHGDMAMAHSSIAMMALTSTLRTVFLITVRILQRFETGDCRLVLAEVGDLCMHASYIIYHISYGHIRKRVSACVRNPSNQQPHESQCVCVCVCVCANHDGQSEVDTSQTHRLTDLSHITHLLECSRLYQGCRSPIRIVQCMRRSQTYPLRCNRIIPPWLPCRLARLL